MDSLFALCARNQNYKNTSTRASFFSSLFAVARIALIAFAVTSSPESELTGQLPRYFTLNWTPSTIGSTSPGPESSSNFSWRGAEEERDPEREDFRILFRIDTILPFAWSTT